MKDPIEDRVAKLEERVDKLEDESKQQAIVLGKLEVYIQQIFQRFDSLEARIIGIISGQTKSADKNSERWQEVVKELIKVIVYVTGAILGAKLFMNG